MSGSHQVSVTGSVSLIDGADGEHGGALNASTFRPVLQNSMSAALGRDWRSMEQSRPSSTPLTSQNKMPLGQHHLSYSGAGRFWKPPDPEDHERGFLRKLRKRGQSSTTAEITSPLSTPSIHSHHSFLSSASSSDNVDSIVLAREDEPRTSLSPIPRQQSSAPSEIAVNQSSYQAQQLAKKIATDERERKTIEHLRRLHAVAIPEVTSTAIAEMPDAQSTRHEAPTELQSRSLYNALRLDFQPSQDNWADLHTMLGGQPTTENEQKKAGDEKNRADHALMLKPDVFELSSDGEPQNPFAELPGDTTSTHTMDMSRMAPSSTPATQSTSSGTPSTLYEDQTEQQTLEEQHVETRKGTTAVPDMRLDEPETQRFSLFSDLDLLKKSVPTRGSNANPRPVSRLPHVLESPLPELLCELSASPSVIHRPDHRPAASEVSRISLDTREQRGFPARPLSSYYSQYPTTHSKSEAVDSPTAPRVSQGEPYRQRNLSLDIEPTIDPRTGRTYVNFGS